MEQQDNKSSMLHKEGHESIITRRDPRRAQPVESRSDKKNNGNMERIADMTIIPQAPEHTDHIRPIQLITVGDQTQVPAPFIRVTTCGLLTIEIVEEVVSTDPPLARYASLTPEQLRGRGTAPSLHLLKLFLNRHERFASRDWLMEQFCRDGELFSAVRLDNIVSLLRSLLCPSASAPLRTHLVAHVRGSTRSQDGFQLASYPFIWVDSDALTWHVQQAARMERFGDDGLPFWERAYQIAKRGPYLPDEIDSDWTTFRCREVVGMLRQSVQALARLYATRHGGAGEEEALLLLRSYWQAHPREEDALRPLMELLARRECYHEALEYYEQLQKLLAQDDLQPDAQTQDLAEYVRTKQLQRAPLTTAAYQAQVPASDYFPMTANRDAIIDSEQRGPGKALSQTALFQRSSLVAPEDNLMSSFDESRRLVLQQLLGITNFVVSASLLSSSNGLTPSLLKKEGIKRIDKHTFFNLQRLIEMCWQFCNAGQMQLTEQILESFLPDIIDSASFQQEAAILASQGLRLKSILCAHQLQLPQMIPLCQQSVAYAQVVNDTNVLSSALNGLAVAFKYNQQQQRSFEAYEAALLASEHATPLLRSRVSAGAAAAFASRGLKQEAFHLIDLAYQQFPDHPENDPTFLSADNGLFMLAYYKGLLYLALEQPEEAMRAFESYQEGQGDQTIPERNRLEILNHRGRTALLLDDLDMYAFCLEEGITGALAIQSQKRLDEVIAIFQEQMPHSWRVEPAIKQLIEKWPLLAAQS